MATTYLSPGVYIEEVDRGTKPIQGVPTSITAFVGFTQKAETLNEDGYTTRSILSEPKLVTNWGQYQQQFGGLIEDAYLPYAVRGFFDNGGAICHVISVRAFGEPHPAQGLVYAPSRRDKSKPGEPSLLFHAAEGGPAGNELTIRIEAPGSASSSARRSPSPSRTTPAAPESDATTKADTKKEDDSAAESSGSSGSSGGSGSGSGGSGSSGGGASRASSAGNSNGGDFTIVVERGGRELERQTVMYDTLPFFGDRARETADVHTFEHIKVWTLQKTGKLEERLPMFTETPLAGGAAQLDVEFVAEQERRQLAGPQSNQLDQIFGNNSVRLFEGNTTRRKGIGALDAVDNINLICAPDVMLAHQKGWITDEQLRSIQQAMLDHCRRASYRFAILDAPHNKKTAEEILDWRMNEAGYDSMYGALYYPWVKIADPVTGRSRFLPPSGFVAGIYARSDDERGVHKAPANEVVAGVIDVETNVTKGEQDLLNPNGINCIRKFAGRGVRIWGARTLSSDPSWRYINVRRLFNYVEESVENSTQWIVFEPNDQVLWAKVRRDITAFLRTVWLSGALFGATPEQAFYVKCDAETNLPELRDLGQMVCEIGMAPVKPAEFVIFRFSQWTDQTEA